MSEAILHRIKLIGPYGYVPNAGAAIFFSIVFAIECVCLSYAAIRHRKWWLLCTLGLGAFFESAGSVIRAYSHWHPDYDNPYIAQQVLLVLTPALFAAVHFTILSKLIKAHNPTLISPITPKLIIIGFVVIDVLSLVIQAAGSGLAATAEEDAVEGDPVSSINKYGYVVVGGLAIQLFGYIAFDVLYVYFWKSLKPNQVSRKFLIAVFASAICILARSIFRITEMSVGWIGSVAVTEWCFLVFDSLLVSSALMILLIVSPAKHLPNEREIPYPISYPESMATVKNDVV